MLKEERYYVELMIAEDTVDSFIEWQDDAKHGYYHDGCFITYPYVKALSANTALLKMIVTESEIRNKPVEAIYGFKVVLSSLAEKYGLIETDD